MDKNDPKAEISNPKFKILVSFILLTTSDCHRSDERVCSDMGSYENVVMVTKIRKIGH